MTRLSYGIAKEQEGKRIGVLYTAHSCVGSNTMQGKKKRSDGERHGMVDGNQVSFLYSTGRDAAARQAFLIVGFLVSFLSLFVYSGCPSLLIVDSILVFSFGVSYFGFPFGISGSFFSLYFPLFSFLWITTTLVLQLSHCRTVVSSYFLEKYNWTLFSFTRCRLLIHFLILLFDIGSRLNLIQVPMELTRESYDIESSPITSTVYYQHLEAPRAKYRPSTFAVQNCPRRDIVPSKTYRPSFPLSSFYLADDREGKLT